MVNLSEIIGNNTVIVLDTETTGLRSDEDKADKIFEISARKIIGGEISNALFLYRDDKFKIDNSAIAIGINVCKVNDGTAIREYACNILTDLNYNTPLLFVGDDRLTLEASDINSAVKKLKRFICKGILCGYNLSFDLKFLNQYEAFDEIQPVDLLPVVREKIGGKVRNLQLKTVCKYFAIDTDKKSDITLASELLLTLL